jgi:hypothetical protein
MSDRPARPSRALPPWQYVFAPARPLTEAELAELTTIPGVRFATKGPHRGCVEAAWHAGWLAQPILERAGGARIVAAPPAVQPLAWGDLVGIWQARGEVREWVYDFATPYQRAGIVFAAARPGAHLWWPGGSGKTLALTLWALLASGPVVIVTKANAREQWAKEVQRFTLLAPFVLKPVAEYRRRDRWRALPDYLAWCGEAGQRPFVIASWPGLRGAVNGLVAMGPVSVGLDEAQHGKGFRRGARVRGEDGVARWRDADNTVAAAAKLCRGARRRLCTTATPVKDRLRDLWGQLDLAEPGAWGWGSLGWMKRYTAAVPGPFGGWVTTGTPPPDVLAELNARLGFVVHRVDYAETHRHLPPKRRESRYLSPSQCNAAGKGFAAELKAAAKRGQSALLECQLARTASMKRGAVAAMVADEVAEGHKIVVFTGRIADCDALGRAVQAEVAKVATGTVPIWIAHGDNTSPSQREEIRCTYMDAPGPAVIVGTGAAWGTAYNLHDTDCAIFAMLPWNGGDLHQWEQRFARQQQKRPVRIVYVICEGTVDEMVAGRIISKLPAMEQVTGDRETAGAYDALAGVDDKEALAASILAKLAAVADEADVDDD